MLGRLASLTMPPWLPLVLKLLPYLVIVGLCGALTITRGSLHSARLEATIAQNALKTTVANYRMASANAQTAAHAAAVAANAASSALKEQSDHDTQIALGDAQRRADAYIANHRVRAGSTDLSRPRDAGMPETSPIATSGNDKTTDAVVVTAQDVKICTENSINLAQVYEWANAQPH